VNNNPGGWVPVDPVQPGPATPAAPKRDEVVISNLRLEREIGRGSALTFDCEFANGAPGLSARYVAVVTVPGQKPEVVRLHGIMGAKETVSLSQFGGIGGWPRGTSVYLAKNYYGPNSPTPSPVSNTLSLP
jgi:hypothetical protein